MGLGIANSAILIGSLHRSNPFVKKGSLDKRIGLFRKSYRRQIQIQTIDDPPRDTFMFRQMAKDERHRGLVP
jgi:hypothetical protein